MMMVRGDEGGEGHRDRQGLRGSPTLPSGQPSSLPSLSFSPISLLFLCSLPFYFFLFVSISPSHILFPSSLPVSLSFCPLFLFFFFFPPPPAFPFNFQHSPGVDSCPILWIALENDKHTVSGLSKLLIHQEDPRNRCLQFSCTWEDGDLNLASNPVCSSRK